VVFPPLDGWPEAGTMIVSSAMAAAFCTSDSSSKCRVEGQNGRAIFASEACKSLKEFAAASVNAPHPGLRLSPLFNGAFLIVPTRPIESNRPETGCVRSELKPESSAACLTQGCPPTAAFVDCPI